MYPKDTLKSDTIKNSEQGSVNGGDSKPQELSSNKPDESVKSSDNSEVTSKTKSVIDNESKKDAEETVRQ